MTIVFFAAFGAHTFAILLPAAKNVICALAKSYFSKLSTIISSFLNFIFLPSLF